MQKLIVPLMLLFFCGASLQAQVRFTEFENVEWWAQVGGFAYQYVNFIETDDEGNVYVAGTFDRELYLAGRDGVDYQHWAGWLGWDYYDSHAFFAKYDPEGKLTWVNALERTPGSSLFLEDFKVTGAGDSYAMLSFKGQAHSLRGDIYTSLPPDTLYNALGLRLDRDGNMEALMQASHPSSNVTGDCIHSLPDGGFFAAIACNRFPVTINDTTYALGSAYVLNGYSHKLFMRFGQDGELEVAQPLLNKHGYSRTGLCHVDRTGNILLTLHFEPRQGMSEFIYDGEEFAAWGNFVYWFDQRLEFVRRLKFDGYIDFYTQIETDVKGNLIISRLSYAWDSTLGASATNANISKINPEGDTLWSVATLAGRGSPTGLAINGPHLYWTGVYNGTLKLGNSTYWNGSFTGYLAKIDQSNGEVIWVMSDTIQADPQKTFGGIAAGANGNLHFLVDFYREYVMFGGDKIHPHPITDLNDGLVVTLRDTIIPKEKDGPVFAEWITVYPNPNPGTFTVGLHENTPEGGRIEIRDMLGRKLYETLLEGKPQTLIYEDTKLASGLYLVNYRNDKYDINDTRYLIINTTH